MGSDTSSFYDSRMNLEFDIDYNRKNSDLFNYPEDVVNTCTARNSRDMSILPDQSVHLIVTSPPYNAVKDYNDNRELGEYLSMIEDVLRESFRVLVDGGRCCINIANVGRKPYVPLRSYIEQIAIKIGFLQRGEIIWDKGASAGSSTAWGSWKSPSNPFLRDRHEYILVFSKGTLSRKGEIKEGTVSRDDFLEGTLSVWTFPTASASKIGHPAPFPVELPRRCIELYSFEDDVVLDPFSGSGQTAIACIETGREYICFDESEEFIKLSRRRIEDFLSCE